MRRFALRRVLAAFICATVVVAPTCGVSADSALPSAPTHGDLTHLTFTATGPLHVALISPEPDGASDSPAALFEVSTVAGAGVELSVGEDVIAFSKIGKRTVDVRTGETRYFYYGVPLEPGPNRVTITPLGANGSRGGTLVANIYGPGRPIALQAAIEGTLRADGRTRGVLRIQATDPWRHHALPGAMVRVSVVSGDASFDLHGGSAPALAEAFGSGESPAPAETLGPAASPTSAVTKGCAAWPPPGIGENGLALVGMTRSVEVPLGTGGIALIPIIGGLRSGDVAVHVVSGDLATDAQGFVAPNLRAPMVDGLVTVGLGQVPGVPGDAADVANGADSRKGRIALFATGAVGSRAVATLAYDTAGSLLQTPANGSFVDDPNARPYPIYGDASLRRDDALSSNRLYALVESGRSSAMWGQFTAQTGPTSEGLGGFNLLVDGAKVELGTKSDKLMAFAAHNNVAYARTLLSPTGLSVLGVPLRADIVIGSDVVTLSVLDRRTGAVLQQTALTRNVDYTLDYATGSLRFINIPLPFDPNFNPQQVVVQYEYQGAGANAVTTGGRFDATLGAAKQVRFGIGFVNDATGAGNFSLLGEDLGGALPGGSWSLAHLASRGAIPTAATLAPLVGNGGHAYRAALSTSFGPNRLQVGFDSTSAGYDNPFGGLSTPGLLDYHAMLTRSLGAQKSEFSLAFDHQQNSGLGTSNAQSDVALRWHKRFTPRLTLSAGLDARSSSGAGPALTPGGTVPASPVPAASGAPAAATSSGTATQATVGVDYKLTDRIGLAMQEITGIGGSGATTASAPAQTSAQLNIDFPQKGRAYVRELWSAAPTQSFAAATSSLTTAARSTSSTAFGFERSLGAATAIDSEYIVDRSGSGGDVYSAIGVKEKLSLSSRVKGDAFVQRARAVGAGLAGFNVYGLNLSYADGSRMRATGSYQLRTGDGSGATIALGATGALSSDVSLLAALDNARANGIVSDDARVGIAYRPSRNDRAAALLGFEQRSGNDAGLGTHTDVLTFEPLFRATHRLEIAGRYAYKLDGDAYYPAHTSLIGLRVDQRIGARFDLGAEARYLDVRGTSGSASGAALEAGLRAGDSMRLAAGFNFTGAPDPSLAHAPSRRGIYVTATSVIDRIFGWGK